MLMCEKACVIPILECQNYRYMPIHRIAIVFFRTFHIGPNAKCGSRFPHFLKKYVTMIWKYHYHKLQTNP